LLLLLLLHAVPVMASKFFYHIFVTTLPTADQT
jgi:hypothetical protein